MEKNGDLKSTDSEPSCDNSPFCKTAEIPCCIRGVDIHSAEEPKDLSPDMNIAMETPEKWINAINETFNQHSKSLQNIRPWEIPLHYPTAFNFQAAGLALGLIYLTAVPFLGVIGFTAIGPVAGSIAAGWQASLGIVQAGSLFAWCQSAAMGGAAASALTSAGVAGAATAGAATVATNGNLLKEKLARAFQFTTDAFNHAADTLRDAREKEQESTEANADVPEHGEGNPETKL